MSSSFSLFVLLTSLLSVAMGQFELDLPWTMEGGSGFREGVVSYDGAADTTETARYFYYSLNEGITNCSKNTPDTASGTPVYYNGVWIVGDCENNMVGFMSAERTPATVKGGKMTPLWKMPVILGVAYPEPRFATPVIDSAGVNGMPAGTMYVLFKDERNPLLCAYLLQGDTSPQRLWTFALHTLTGRTGGINGTLANFTSFSEDHAIFWHGGFVYVPSADSDVLAIFDVSNTQTSGSVPKVILTLGQWSDSHRLMGSSAGAGNGWSDAVFLVKGSLYGIQSYARDGTVTAGGVQFNQYSNEFSHPVTVTFTTDTYGTTECVIATEYDPVGGIFISGVDALNISYPCGYNSGTTVWNCEFFSPLFTNS